MRVIRQAIFLILLGFANSCILPDHPPRVDTRLGTIVGSYKASVGGRWYAAYEGIPYAEPPLGKLRFDPPKPVKKWDGDLIATKKGTACTQYTMVPDASGDRVMGCEDCLYLNIYVPARNDPSERFPVLFWIPGGAFQFGTGNDADESRFMDRNVILVTINYRVGPFGFLSTGTRAVPGNMGLKDQNMALKWVSVHIKNFGGNPQQITLFGFGAGGMSVHYHYLSPLSAGLFQRGISLSGNALDPSAQTERAPEKAKQLAALLGCPTKIVSKMIDCLQERPARQIAQAVGEFKEWLYNPITPFGPVVESQAILPRAFIHRSPIDIIRKGDVLDVPWVTGVVSEEGLYPAAEFVANATLLAQLNDEWLDIAPYLLDFNDTIPRSDQDRASQKVRNHYLGKRQINSDTVTPVIHMVGDRLFAVNHEKAARLQAAVNRSPVWTYYYSYRAEYSLSDLLTGTNEDFGVSHGDDINLVIEERQANTNRSTDQQMQETLLDFYSSFAANGQASFGGAQWPALDPTRREFRYLHISDPENITMEGDDNFAEKDFWNTIPFKENLSNQRDAENR